MNARPHATLSVLLCCLAAACANSNKPPTCSFDNPATLAVSSWPQFHHDRANTGNIDNAPVSTIPALRWVFAATPNEAFQASPVLNTDDQLIYIGSTGGTLYVINTADPCTAGTEKTHFLLNAEFGLTSTALLGLRDDMDAIFVGSEDGRLFALDGTGAAQDGFWPFFVGGSVSAAPNLSVENGIVLAGSLSAIFVGVCPNGIARFSRAAASIGSAPAVGPDGIVYFGASDGQLRAVDSSGNSQWTFSTAAPIVDSAPVLEVENGATVAIYVANVNGQVFKITPSGQAFQPPFELHFPSETTRAPVGPIHSSPAFAEDRLYFGSNDGNLYAADATTGEIIWTVFTSADGIVSSPAVATVRTCRSAPDTSCLADTDCPADDTCVTQRVVVVGANDGNVYFVEDDGSTMPPYQTFSVGSAVRSSPAIDQDGTVYVGADDGHLYAFGSPVVCGAARIRTGR